MRIHAENLSLDRGGRRLFAGLSFDLNEGELLVVQGSNGAGKSSLLRAIAGFLSFSGGFLRHEGGDAQSNVGEQMHYLGHSDSLRPALTAGENLSFWAEMLGGAVSGVKPALLRLGLPHIFDFPVRALSAGQKRRVALSRLLIAQRAVWLLDEPMTALDVGGQTLLAHAMRDHLSEGGSIIAATHAPLGIASTRQIQLDSIGFVSPGAAV